jgi:uncharacterized protein
MSKGLPELIYPHQLARSGRSLQGQIPVARMWRLAETLCSTAGEIVIDLRFGRGNQEHLCIQGTIHSELRLICQRCLGPLSWSADCEVRLALVPAAIPQGRLESGYEPLIAQEDSPLSVVAMVEDELILALPLVPMHPKNVCPGTVVSDPDVNSDLDAQESPFAVLKNLKRRLTS